jgi:hypothetical protein
VILCPGPPSGKQGLLCQFGCFGLASVADGLDDLSRRRARTEYGVHASGLQCRNVIEGNDAAAKDQYFACTLILQLAADFRDQGHVRTGKHAQTHRINIFLKSSRHNIVGLLVEAGINDFHSGIAQGAGDHLGPPVMAI